MNRAKLAILLCCFMVGQTLALTVAIEDLALEQVHTHMLKAKRLSKANQDPIAVSIMDTVAAIETEASCGLERLFSAEEGSWPFETFVRNGLFPPIVQYQRSHPQAIWLKGGKHDLASLHQCINNEKILTKKGDVYHLNYPLIVAADAALLVNESTLFLNGSAAAVLINLGNLVVRASEIASISGDDGYENYNAFIVSWGGSGVYLKNANLNGLGFPGNLTGGLSVVVNKHQESVSEKSKLFVSDSTFSFVRQPLRLEYADASIYNSTFYYSAVTAVTLKHGNINFIGNTIERVEKGEGLQLTDVSRATVASSSFKHITSHAVKVNNLNRRMVVQQNTFQQNEGNGVTVLDTRLSLQQRLDVFDNTFDQNNGSGVATRNIGDVRVDSNRFTHNLGYGVNHANLTEQKKGKLTLFANQYDFNGNAALKASGVKRILVNKNHYKITPPFQLLFSGELRAYQSSILKRELKQLSTLLEVSG